MLLLSCIRDVSKVVADDDISELYRVNKDRISLALLGYNIEHMRKITRYTSHMRTRRLRIICDSTPTIKNNMSTSMMVDDSSWNCEQLTFCLMLHMKESV